MRYEDKATLERLERKLAPALREQQFISDLEVLKGLTRMAELKHQLQKKDAIDSGGDIDAVGQSMDRERLEDRDQLFLRVLKKIADDIPSEWSKNMQAVTRSADPAATQAKEQRARPTKSSAPGQVNIIAGFCQVHGMTCNATNIADSGFDCGPEPTRLRRVLHRQLCGLASPQRRT